jgi:hypothetical protein
MLDDGTPSPKPFEYPAVISRRRLVKDAAARFACPGLAACVTACVTACAIPRREAKLPPPNEAYVAVLSGEMPASLSQVARHSWIIANVPGENYPRRYEWGGSGTDPFDYFGDGDVALHAVIHYDKGDLLQVTTCMRREASRYNEEHPDYWPIPGPNSNTFVDFVLRHCGVHVELPATAIGRDYRGPIGASVTSLGTGVQLETWVLGVKVGLQEGVELHLLDLPIGVHFWPPGITVPVNPGRIGFDDSAHHESVPRRHQTEWDRDREYGLASLWLGTRYARVLKPGDAGGLSDTGAFAFQARAAYGTRIAYALGTDLEAGVGVPLGFAYAARLYPAGIALLLERNTFLGAYAGIGSEGVTTSVPGSFEIPTELRLEIDVAPSVRTGLRAEVDWFPASAFRRGGSILSPFADALGTSGFVRIGQASRCGCPGQLGRGYFFAIERREVMRSAWLGVTFGVEADFGG